MKCSKIWLQTFWIFWLCALPPLSSDFPFLCPKYPWPTLSVFYSLQFLLWCPGKILWLVSRAQLLQILLRTPCTHQLKTGLYQTAPKSSCFSPIGPLYFLGSTSWLFWGFLIFRFLRHPAASFASFHKNADTMQVFEWLVVYICLNFGVCGDILSPKFVIDVVHRFLVLLSQILYLYGGIWGNSKNVTAIFPEFFSLKSFFFPLY